jgi:hypothetical protein
VRSIEEITAVAERDGSASLPALTQADLCVLGAADKALVCQRTWDWWMGLGERGRADSTDRALEFLAYRKLIVPVSGDVPAVPVPELGLILSARSNPEPLVTCQVPGIDAGRCPRFFGMTERDNGLRVLVCEALTGRTLGPGDQALFGTMLTYTLVTPFRAGKMLTEWARAAAGFSVSEPPVIDIFAPGQDGRLAQGRYEVRQAGGFAFEVRQPAVGLPPERLDDMQVTRKLALALIGSVA